MLSAAATDSCDVFTCSGKSKSVDEDALVPRTMIGTPDTSLAGLMGPTDSGVVDEVSEPL